MALRATRAVLLVATVFAATAAHRAAAQDASSATPGPTVISMGVYLLQLQNVDLKVGTADVTYYVWTRWRGDVDGAAFEVMNGTVTSKDDGYRVDDDGAKYVIHRCRATVQVEVNYRRFPFDVHELSIAFEHSDYGATIVVAAVDERGVRSLRAPSTAGWIVGSPRYRVSESLYRTSWGVPGVGPEESTRSSRFTVSVELRHAPIATAAKTFVALVISVLITALAFAINPSDLSSRVGVCVAGTFGALTSHTVVSSSLPDIPYMTLSDELHVTGLGFVFATMLVSCVVGHLARTDRKAMASRIDRLSALACSVGLALTTAMVLAWS